MNTPNPEEIVTNPFTAAVAGAVVGLKAVPGTTFLERLANVVLGTLIAVFTGPALVEYLHVTSMKVAAGLTFAVGTAGLVAFSAIMDGIKQTPVRDIIVGWIARRPPPPPPA